MARQGSLKNRSFVTGGGILGTEYTSTGVAQLRGRRTYSTSEAIIGVNHRGPPYRSGGPMFLTRTKLSYADSSKYFGSIAGGAKKNAYEGVFQVGYVPTAYPVPSRSLNAIGTEAISRTIPTNPSASLAQYLGELKDLPGMIRQTQTFFRNLARSKVVLSNVRKNVGDALDHFSNPGAAAGDYLNLQFGWVPMLRDLQGFYKAGKNMNKRIAFLKRNLGKRVPRSRTMETWDYSTLAEATVNNALAPTLSPSVHSFLYSGSNPRSTQDRIVEHKGRIWFEAVYTYYSPEIATADPWTLRADALGLRLDAELIYQLTPWSWLIDWFTTTGAVIHNTVEMSRHHVVLHHGFVMAHMSTKHKVKAMQKMYTGYAANTNKISAEYVASAECLYETKQRVVANPFGFGTNWDGITPYQASILAALGISRRSHDQ